MSSARLQEDKKNYVRDNDVLPKQGNYCWARCNYFMLVSGLLFLLNICLALYVSGIFDSSTDNTADTQQDDLTRLHTQDTQGDEYLTGHVAPNMLFLLADDMGFADISLNGAPYSTPYIDELVTKGIQFTDFHTHELCTPTRIAFLTGRYAWRTGLQFTHVTKGLKTAHMPLSETTWAEVTKEMGYDNYYVGRWGVGYASWEFTPTGRGWDTFEGYFGPEIGYYSHRADVGDWPDVFDFMDNREDGIKWDGMYSEDIFLERTLKHLSEAKEKGKPFTLTYASQTAHTPIDEEPESNPPITFEECSQWTGAYAYAEVYCNKVKYLDYVWGIIIEYLKETRMWDNMVIFTTSDNGALPYTNTDWYGWGCNWPYRGGKQTYYEGGIKNWFGISGGLVPIEYQGTTFDLLTHASDIAATAMRLSMTETEFQGRGTLTGTSKIVDGNNLWAFEHHELIIYNVLPQWVPSVSTEAEVDYAATDGEWKFIVGFEDASGMGSGWYNYPGLNEIIDKFHSHEIWTEAGGNCSTGCLFHMTSDPYEFNDLSAYYPEITDYFTFLIDAIYRGGFDEFYHPGQPFEYDYRGVQPDGILRPYINSDSVAEYHERLSLTSNGPKYNYQNFSQFWHGEYNGIDSPF